MSNTSTTSDTAPPPILLSIPETCAALGVSRSTCYELATRGDLEVVRIGRRALVPRASIEAFVERLRETPSGGAGDAA